MEVKEINTCLQEFGTNHSFTQEDYIRLGEVIKVLINNGMVKAGTTIELESYVDVLKIAQQSEAPKIDIKSILDKVKLYRTD